MIHDEIAGHEIDPKLLGFVDPKEERVKQGGHGVFGKPRAVIRHGESNFTSGRTVGHGAGLHLQGVALPQRDDRISE